MVTVVAIDLSTANRTIREEVAKISDDEETLEFLRKDKEWQVRAEVGGNICTPKTVLKELSKDLNPRVRQRVAGNPKTPQEDITRLTNDSEYWNEEPYVIVAGAGNPSASVEDLVRLSQSSYWRIRAAVAGNPSTPYETRYRLFKNDSHKEVLKAAITQMAMEKNTDETETQKMENLA